MEAILRIINCTCQNHGVIVKPGKVLLSIERLPVGRRKSEISEMNMNIFVNPHLILFSTLSALTKEAENLHASGGPCRLDPPLRPLLSPAEICWRILKERKWEYAAWTKRKVKKNSRE